MKCVYVLDNLQPLRNIQRLIVLTANMCHGKFSVCVGLDEFQCSSSMEQM